MVGTAAVVAARLAARVWRRRWLVGGLESLRLMSVTHCLVNGADRGGWLFCIKRHKWEIARTARSRRAWRCARPSKGSQVEVGRARRGNGIHSLFTSLCNSKNDGVAYVSRVTQETQSSPNLAEADPREVPPSFLQRAAAWPPMMALLLGSIEAPHEACSQPARSSEVKWKWSVMPPP